MARPKIDSLDAPWKLKDMCPCSNGANYEDCCLNSDGTPLIQIPSLIPTGQISGHVNKKCYLNFTRNCCQKISKEHFVSKSILSQFKGLRVGGMPWQNTGEENNYHPNNLTSKILCQRHNNSLSPLDSAASHFFRELFKAANHVKKSSISTRSAYFLVSGDALELWALKTLTGLFHAKVAQSNGTVMHGNYQFSTNIIEEAFWGHGIQEPKGIYCQIEIGNLVQEDLQFAPLSSSLNRTLNGLAIKACGITFNFIFDVEGSNSDFF
jgi:hypothetical protein